MRVNSIDWMALVQQVNQIESWYRSDQRINEMFALAIQSNLTKSSELSTVEQGSTYASATLNMQSPGNHIGP